MKQYYLFFILILPAFLQAQLYVQPGNGVDNFIYVNDELLYVNGKIDLKQNKNAYTQASIYLRNEGELLQGLKDNTNSGDGYLSVFQKGTSNEFDYNYWGMPVKTNGKTLDQILFDPKDKTESTKIGLTGGQNGDSQPLTIATKWIYKFSGVGYNSWDHVGNQINKLSPGLGFSMKGTKGTNNVTVNGVKNNPGSNQRYDFRGTPNSGDIKVQVNAGNSILVGNPYPSTVNLDAFLNDPDNDITGTAYFWDSKENGNSHYLKDYQGGYGAYTPGGGYVAAAYQKYANRTGQLIEGSVEGRGAWYDRKYLPIAQGFMLVGTKNGGSATFKNSHRVYKRDGATGYNLKTQDNSDKNASVILKNAENSNIRLNVSMDDLYTRQLLLAFNEKSTKGVDKAMDAQMYGKLGSDAAWNINGGDFMIRVTPFDRSDLIALNVNTTKTMEVDFSIEKTELFDNEKIYLYDKEKNTYNDITKDHYKLVLNGEFKDRFFIAFHDDTPTEEEKVQISEKEAALAAIDIFQNNNEGKLQILIPQEISANYVSVFNLNGAAVFQKEIKQSEKEISYSTSNLMSAIYIVQIKTSDNRTVTKKITVKN